jgi:site-specific DNA-methyltransferase (adenine-specific)
VRIETIGDATLYLGEALDVLPTVTVDCVITDPPYSANTHKMAMTNKGAGHGVSLITFAALTGEDFDAVMSACLLSSGGWVVATCDYKHAARYYEAPEFVRLGAWVKPNPMPQISADRPGQGFETVLILHSGKVPKKWNRGGGAGIWQFPVHTASEVPTQKPLALISCFVNDFTQPGQTVADPFMGSGTTGVASLMQGRKFVGVEVNQHHFSIACRRIEQAAKQGQLFEPAAPKLVQLGLEAA